jgi:hypothetical protein
VNWEPDGAAGVGNAAGDGLADPPCGVRRELEALAPIELLDGVHQPEVALLDEIEQGQTRRLVLLCDRHHQTEVGLHERPLGILALTCRTTKLALLGSSEVLADLVELFDRRFSGFDLFGEPNLVVLGEQHVLTNIGQIQAD